MTDPGGQIADEAYAAGLRDGRAEALREAAKWLRTRSIIVNGLAPTASPREVYAAWLDQRADRIEREQQP